MPTPSTITPTTAAAIFLGPNVVPARCKGPAKKTASKINAPRTTKPIAIVLLDIIAFLSYLNKCNLEVGWG